MHDGRRLCESAFFVGYSLWLICRIEWLASNSVRKNLLTEITQRITFPRVPAEMHSQEWRTIAPAAERFCAVLSTVHRNIKGYLLPPSHLLCYWNRPYWCRLLHVLCIYSLTALATNNLRSSTINPSRRRPLIISSSHDRYPGILSPILLPANTLINSSVTSNTGTDVFVSFTHRTSYCKNRCN